MILEFFSLNMYQKILDFCWFEIMWLRPGEWNWPYDRTHLYAIVILNYCLMLYIKEE